VMVITVRDLFMGNSWVGFSDWLAGRGLIGDWLAVGWVFWRLDLGGRPQGKAAP